MNETDILLFAVIAVAVNGLIGCIVGNGHDVKSLGFLTGFLLGPIGWLVVFAVGVGKNQQERMELASSAMARRSATRRRFGPSPGGESQIAHPEHWDGHGTVAPS